MHIEKKYLVSKQTAPMAKSNSQFRVDLSKPAPARVLTASSGKHIKDVTIEI